MGKGIYRRRDSPFRRFGDFAPDRIYCILDAPMGGEFDVKAPDANAVYLRMKTAKITDGIMYGGDIFNGAKLLMGLKLDSSGYAGEIQDISILPEMGRGKGELLIAVDQIALRAEIRMLIRASRIARPEALYDASVASRTFGDVDRVLENPIDSEALMRVLRILKRILGLATFRAFRIFTKSVGGFGQS